MATRIAAWLNPPPKILGSAMGGQVGGTYLCSSVLVWYLCAFVTLANNPCLSAHEQETWKDIASCSAFSRNDSFCSKVGQPGTSVKGLASTVSYVSNYGVTINIKTD